MSVRKVSINLCLSTRLAVAGSGVVVCCKSSLSQIMHDISRAVLEMLYKYLEIYTSPCEFILSCTTVIDLCM